MTTAEWRAVFKRLAELVEKADGPERRKHPWILCLLREATQGTPPIEAWSTEDSDD